MDGSRKRLVPFVKRMIGRCPGVVWENQDEGTFRIPWRHFNNREWSEDNSRIFLEWAKTTGRYKPGDECDWPSWKTQLRCALNKIPDIVPVPELYRFDIPNPYRVYRFVAKSPNSSEDAEASPTPSPDSTEDVDDSTNSPHMQDLDRILEKELGGCSANPKDKLFAGFTSQNVSAAEYTVYHAATLVPTVVSEVEQQGMAQYYVLNNAGIPHSDNQTYYMYQQEMEPHCTGSSKQIVEVEATDFLTNEIYSPPMMAVPVTQVTNIPISDDVPIQAFAVSTPNIPVTNSMNEQQASRNSMLENTEPMETSLPSDLKSLEAINLCPLVPITSETLSSVPSSFGSNPSVPVESGPMKTGENSENTERVRPEIHILSPSRSFVVLKPDEVVFTFKLFYGCQKQVEVMNQPVTRRGCRLYFPKQDPTFWDNTLIKKTPEVFGPPSVEQIEIPSEASSSCLSIEPGQKCKLRQLLENMERGLVFTCHGADIYAQRLCKTRVFVTDGLSKSKLLERQKESEKIFDFCHQGEMKKPTQILTFGQEIKTGHNDPMKRVLMSIEIEHQGLKSSLNEKFPSMTSFNPLISHDDKADALLKQFRELTVHNKTY